MTTPNRHEVPPNVISTAVDKTLNATDEKIGYVVRLLRTAQPSRGDQVAHACGLSLDEFYESEIGRRRFSARELHKLSIFFNVPMAVFFEQL